MINHYCYCPTLQPLYILSMQEAKSLAKKIWLLPSGSDRIAQGDVGGYRWTATALEKEFHTGDASMIFDQQRQSSPKELDRKEYTGYLSTLDRSYLYEIRGVWLRNEWLMEEIVISHVAYWYEDEYHNKIPKFSIDSGSGWRSGLLDSGKMKKGMSEPKTDILRVVKQIVVALSEDTDFKLVKEWSHKELGKIYKDGWYWPYKFEGKKKR